MGREGARETVSHKAPCRGPSKDGDVEKPAPGREAQAGPARGVELTLCFRGIHSSQFAKKRSQFSN